MGTHSDFAGNILGTTDFRCFSDSHNFFQWNATDLILVPKWRLACLLLKAINEKGLYIIFNMFQNNVFMGREAKKAKVNGHENMFLKYKYTIRMDKTLLIHG